MTARVDWRPKETPARRTLRGLEWFFLLFGLVALDCFIWVLTGTLLYQSYTDWAFDQTLRGLRPSISGFIVDESHWLFNSQPMPEQPGAVAPAPGPQPTNAPRPAREVIGRLQIPRLKMSAMVREGASERTLSRAIGHIPGTSLPGSVGNVGLAGHRDTFFRALRNIRRDDVIHLQTEDGTYSYRVESTEIVGPRDVSVLKASSGPTLTLVTCYPFYYVGSAPKRFIVHASEVRMVANSRSPQPGS